MFDLSFIRDNAKELEKAAKAKGIKVDIAAILKLDAERRALQQQFDEIRATKKKGGATLSKLAGDSKEKELAKLKKIDTEEQALKPKIQQNEEKLTELVLALPNPPLSSVPEGAGEKDNKVLRTWGEQKKFDFPALDHTALAHRLDLIDFERGAKVGGSGFYYLKNEAALLELALVHYAIDFLAKKGFTPIITPDLARSEFYLGTGYSPRGPEAQTYEIKDQDLGLIATAEVTLAGLHAGELLTEADLPKHYAGYSHCFRQEAGAYGKYSKGLYRVHQFTKVEMFAYVKPEESEQTHQEMLKLEEELWQGLDIPYRVLEMCTGDLGAQAARKFDVEAWMPGRGDYGEVTSTSNTTDYQSRRLNIRYRTKEGTVAYPHTLNGTAIATSRAIIAILENNQQKDGSVNIPKVLQPYMSDLSQIKR